MALVPNVFPFLFVPGFLMRSFGGAVAQSPPGALLTSPKDLIFPTKSRTTNFNQSTNMSVSLSYFLESLCDSFPIDAILLVPDNAALIRECKTPSRTNSPRPKRPSACRWADSAEEVSADIATLACIPRLPQRSLD